MTAKEAMAKWYAEHLPERDFEADILLHRLGLVVDLPDFFLLARGVDIDAPWELIVNPSVLFPRSMHNCWFIFARWGPIERFLNRAPYPLEFVAWSRRGKPFKVYRMQEALRLIQARTRLRPEGAELSQDIAP